MKKLIMVLVALSLVSVSVNVAAKKTFMKGCMALSDDLLSGQPEELRPLIQVILQSKCEEKTLAFGLKDFF